MDTKQKIRISILIIGLFILSMTLSFAYFSAIITGSESTSTVEAIAANLELTYTDGNKQINANGIFPGWSDSKTFTVENTGDTTTYYVLKMTDITNNFKIDGSISYQITSSDGGANTSKTTLPSVEMPITVPIEIEEGKTHNYTITTYYNNLDENQEKDLGSTFSYTITIEATYRKDINKIEDLVKLSKEVNSGTTYKGTTFVLMQDLDFTDDNSYEDPTRTDFGDLNGDETIESIKTELTKEAGKGFTPIGDDSNIFQGNFNGNNKELKDIYINDSAQNSSNGLFKKIMNSTIQDLTISGKIVSNYSSLIGAIVGVANGNNAIINCHNYA